MNKTSCSKKHKAISYQREGLDTLFDWVICVPQRERLIVEKQFYQLDIVERVQFIPSICLGHRKLDSITELVICVKSYAKGKPHETISCHH